MAWTNTLARVVENQKALTPAKVCLTVLTFPFLIIGWVIGLVWLAATLLWSACWVGVMQARELANQRPDDPSAR